jgi:hypothetical protein
VQAVQRLAGDVLLDQQDVAVAGGDGGQHRRGADPGAGGQQPDVGLVLHRLLGSGERGLVLDLPERGPAPQLVEQVGVALLPADRLDEEALAVAGADDERDRAAGVAPHRVNAVRVDPGRQQTLADGGGGGWAGWCARGQVDGGGDRPAEGGPADHVQWQVGAGVDPSQGDQPDHPPGGPPGPVGQPGPGRGGQGGGHGDMPGGVAEAGVDPADDHAGEQGDGSGLAGQALDQLGQQPGQGAGQGEVGGQPGPAGGQGQRGQGRDRGQGAELHHRQQRPTNGVGELVDQPEQLDVEGEHVAAVGGHPARRHHHAAGQHPQHVGGVPLDVP